MCPGSMPAKQGDLSCGAVSSLGCSSCWVFVLVPPPAHSPVHSQGGWQRWWRGLVCFPSALFKNSSFCGALRNRTEPQHGGQWPPSPWERSWLSVLPPPRVSSLLPAPPLPPQMLGTKVSQLSVSQDLPHPLSCWKRNTWGAQGAGRKVQEGALWYLRSAWRCRVGPGWLQPGVTQHWRRLLGAG